MRKSTVLFLVTAMLLGATVANAQRVEEREVMIQERPIEPLEVEADANDGRPAERTPEAQSLAEPSTSTMNTDQSVTDGDRPAVTRVRPDSMQDAREVRVQETRERSVENQEAILQLRENQADDIRERRDAFRDRLREISDQARRDRVERLADNINKVNENLSLRYDGFLGAMELVMDKIEIRIGLIEEANGVDLTTVYSMIDESRRSIVDAREAVLEQRAKIYLVEIDSVETMTEGFREVMQEMRSDHEALKTEVINPLRTLVRDIMSVLREELNRADEDDSNNNS